METRRTEDASTAEHGALLCLHEASIQFSDARNSKQECFETVLRAAIRLTGADKGHLQLFDPVSSSLMIAAQRGFERLFLDFFSSVRQGGSACGEALGTSEQVVVEDVTNSKFFTDEAVRVLLTAGVYGVQSTPLVSSAGHVLGIVSTHFRHAIGPLNGRCNSFNLLAGQAANYLERKEQEQALANATRQMQCFLDTADVALMRCSSDLRYLSVNRAYCESIGLPVEQMVGRPIVEVIGQKAWKEIQPWVERV